jgi:hypothetical protein
MIPSPLVSDCTGRHRRRHCRCRPCVARGLGPRPPCCQCESHVRPGGWARGKGQKLKVTGGIHPCHCRPDAESHGPGSVPVQGMARQPPAPCGRDGWAVVVGPPPQACHCGHGRSILLGHGMAPGGARYADRLEGLARLAQKLVGVVHCGVWVVVIITCVEACACCDAHTFACICMHGHDQCVQS